MKNHNLLIFTIFATTMAAAPALQSCQAQSVPKRSILALSKAEHILAIVDPSTLKVIAKIPVGSDPHEVIASTDGKTAYVSIYGGGSLHEIDVLDLTTQKPSKQVDTRPLFGPHGIEFANGKVWFSAEGSKAVGSYDPASGTVDWSMGTGQDRTHMLYVTPDANRIYTTNVNAGTVSILENRSSQPNRPGGPGGPGQSAGAPPPGGPGGPPPGAPGGPGGPGPNADPKAHREWTQTVVPASRGSEGFDVSPDGKWLWTAASEDGFITVIDLEAKKQAFRMDAKAQGANRLKFTPDGKQVFISSLGTGELIVYDVVAQKEIKRLKIGRGVAGILMDRDGNRAFIACSADSFIAVVDLKTLTVTGHFEVGGTPDGMAWAITQ